MTKHPVFPCGHCKAKYQNEDLAEMCCGLPNNWGEVA